MATPISILPLSCTATVIGEDVQRPDARAGYLGPPRKRSLVWRLMKDLEENSKHPS